MDTKPFYDIVFTNGVFDIIHPGHIKLLREAKKLGRRLIVGINSDDSTRRLKGEGRPINNHFDRKEVLSAIRYVDWVIIFSGDTPYKIIDALRPSVIVKGGDYREEDVVGRDLAPVVIIPLTNHSTTDILRRSIA